MPFSNHIFIIYSNHEIINLFKGEESMNLNSLENKSGFNFLLALTFNVT